jgi:hypothetical protein
MQIGLAEEDFFTRKKKTSTVMTMKKNKKDGKMVRRCISRFHLSFGTLLIAEGRSACACNKGPAKHLM